MVIRLGLGGLAEDPGALLFNGRPGLVVEGEIDDFPGEQILAQPLVIAILAVPILIQVYFNAGLAYMLNRVTGEAHCVAGPSALIGASNFFELAVAAAISLFGFH